MKFQKLSLRVNGILEDKLLDILIGTLKDNILHEVRLFEPTTLDKAFMVERKVESQNIEMSTRMTTANTYKDINVPYSNPPQLTMLTPQKMYERR